MIEKDFINKLNLFTEEIDNCCDKTEFEQIVDRLQRYLKNVYLDDDRFVIQCKVNWGMSPRSEANLSNALGNGYYYVSEQEDQRYYENRISKIKEHLLSTISTIITYIEKDGFPLNNKTMTNNIHINNSTGTNVNTGDIFSGSQSSINNSHVFLDSYNNAVKEVQNADGEILSNEDKEIILDCLACIKDSIDENREPKQSFIKQLSKYNSLELLSIGANFATIIGLLIGA